MSKPPTMSKQKSEIARPSWDHDGTYLAAATRIMRAVKHGTGCTLTAEMAASLNFAEGDGEWWTQTREALGLGLSTEGIAQTLSGESS